MKFPKQRNGLLSLFTLADSLPTGLSPSHYNPFYLQNWAHHAIIHPHFIRQRYDPPPLPPILRPFGAVALWFCQG